MPIKGFLQKHQRINPEVGSTYGLPVCRRGPYALTKGQDIEVYISCNGSNVCACCGNTGRKLPYLIKVKIVSISDRTDKVIHAKAIVEELPDNWETRGRRIH